MAIIIEKAPIEIHARHLGLSVEAAINSYGAQCAGRRRDFVIEGAQYRARHRVDALDQHEYATGRRPWLDVVVEVVA